MNELEGIQIIPKNIIQEKIVGTNISKYNNIAPKLLGGFGEINFGKQYRMGNRVYDSTKIAMCVTANPVGNLGGNSYLYLVEEDNGRSLVKK